MEFATTMPQRADNSYQKRRYQFMLGFFYKMAMTGEIKRYEPPKKFEKKSFFGIE